MPIKVKIGGTYQDAAPFVKRGGVYAAAVASVKAGGVYSLVSGEIAPPLEYEEFDTLFWTSAIQDPSGFVGSGVDANGKSLPVASPGGTPTIRFERTYFPSYGQSLAVGGSGFPALSTEASAVDEMFVRGMRPEDDYYLESGATWYASTVPAAESISPRYATQGETPGRGFADAVREFVTDHYGPQPDLKFHLSAPGQGGIEIIKLMKGNGTGYYERMIAQMQALVTLKSGIETVGMEAMPFIHGERDYLLATTGADYKTRLADICSTIVSDAKTEFGQTNDVQVLGTQVASHIANGNQVNAQIALAQLEADDEIANYHLVCPMYQLPFKGADVHLSALGYIWMAGYLAAAYKTIITDQSTWEIVKPLSYSTSGNVCEVTYNVPAIYDLTNELVFDTTQVAAQADYGFRLFDVSGVQQTISSVAISAPNKVVITAAAAITSGSYIDYARQGDSIKGLGNLRDKAGSVRRSQIMNFDMPLHNWAVISKSGVLA